MSTTLTVALSQDHITLRPGESTDITVTIANTGTLVSHYEILVRGLDPTNYQAQPTRTELNPGDRTTITLRITVPPTGPPHAGRHTLGIVVRTADDKKPSCCEELTLTVPATPSLTAAISPESVEARSQADYTITLTNTGNTALTATLVGKSSEQNTNFIFQPRNLTISPSYTKSVTLEVTAPRPWMTNSTQTLKITTVAGRLNLQNRATLCQKSRFQFTTLSTLGLLFIAVAIITAAIINQ